jgi:hypothetical protein
MNKNQTSIFLIVDLQGGNGHFTAVINTPFVPKTVTVSNLNYKKNEAADDERNAVKLTTDMVNSLDNCIGIIRDEFSSSPMTFKCSSNINGVVNFYYTDPDDFEGKLSFALTFKD